MRLKSRLARLERDVEWLRFWGAIRVAEMKLELIEKMKTLEAHRERRAEAARQARPSPRPPQATSEPEAVEPEALAPPPCSSPLGRGG
jgi:hypothetical protein